MRRRTISWSAALRDLRNDRNGRADIREERLSRGHGSAHALRLTGWRGRSERRYVCRIEAIGLAAILDAEHGVHLAVRRDADGAARVLSAAHGLSLAHLSRWAARQAREGATEIHLYRMEDPSEGPAIVADLTDRLAAVA